MVEDVQLNVTSAGVCAHKLLFPMNIVDFWGLIFTGFWLCFVNTGGIGGGGSMITVSLAFFQFEQK